MHREQTMSALHSTKIYQSFVLRLPADLLALVSPGGMDTFVCVYWFALHVTGYLLPAAHRDLELLPSHHCPCPQEHSYPCCQACSRPPWPWRGERGWAAPLEGK